MITPLAACVALLAVLVIALASAGGAAVRWIPASDLAHWPAERRSGSVERVMASPARATRAATLLQLSSALALGAALTVCFVEAFRHEPWLAGLVGAVIGLVLLALVLLADPRRLGRRHPATGLRLAAPLLSVAMRLLRPLLAVGARGEGEGQLGDADLTGGQLLDLVDRVSDGELLEQDERRLVHSVVEFGETITREVMVPRTDIVTIDIGTPLRKALSLFIRSGFSRVPVIGEDADDLRGVLYLKDVVRRVQADPAAGDAPVDPVMRPALFVPESKPIDDLLRELQSGPSHLAMVVDEYGGIAGLVTIEDVLEEIVGELTDEHDPSAPEIEELGGGRHRVPARLELDELGQLLGLDIDDDDVETVGGLLSKALGKVPIPGAVADVAGVRIEADRTQGRRRQLASVIVSRVPDDGGPA